MVLKKCSTTHFSMEGTQMLVNIQARHVPAASCGGRLCGGAGTTVDDHVRFKGTLLCLGAGPHWVGPVDLDAVL